MELRSMLRYSRLPLPIILRFASRSLIRVGTAFVALTAVSLPSLGQEYPSLCKQGGGSYACTPINSTPWRMDYNFSVSPWYGHYTTLNDNSFQGLLTQYVENMNQDLAVLSAIVGWSVPVITQLTCSEFPRHMAEASGPPDNANISPCGPCTTTWSSGLVENFNLNPAVFYRVHPYCGPNSGVTYTSHAGTCSQEQFACVQRIDPKNLGPPACGSGIGNPINAGTGNKFQQETDYLAASPFPLAMERYYNSMDVGLPGPFGRYWRGEFQRSIEYYPLGLNPMAQAYRANGKVYAFKRVGASFQGDADVPDRLYRDTDGMGNTTGWRYIDALDTVENYDATGRLLKLTSRQGLRWVLQYDSQGRVSSVSDTFGRTLTFAYDASSRVTSMTDPANASYGYQYDSANRLVTVTYPDNSLRTYVYNEQQYTGNANLPNALTGIIDENGSRFAIFRYDATGRATATSHLASAGVEADLYQVAYGVGSGTVIDPISTSRTLGFTTILGSVKNLSSSLPSASCGSTQSVTYESTTGWPTMKVDFNSGVTTYQRNDPYGRADLETQRTEAKYAPAQRTITTTWHPTFRLPLTIVEPVDGGSRVTTNTYDGQGNLIQRLVDAPKNDGTSQTTTRTRSWTYDAFGQVLSATDPNNNVTRYTYYASTDPNPARRGNVATITNPVGHITTVNAYDGSGRALSITDPNGVVTTLSYSSRGWLASRTVGAETTTYAYDAVGQLTRVTNPDGSYVDYSHDGAHRLKELTDGLGNKVSYALDAMGNRLAESVYDPVGTLARTRTQQFDALSRLSGLIGAQGQTTGYTYDNNGNVKTVTDPLTHQTGDTYDALNRVIQVVDPAGTTTYGYDAGGNLANVTDPRRSVITTYTYDGFGNRWKEVSPDTGTTTSTFDAANNMLTRTDARGATSTYTYDRLHRPTQVGYSSSFAVTETHIYTYDSGANAKGRLTSIADGSATTNWTYNAQGRVASKSQKVGALTHAVTYGYNAAGQIDLLTTPSGQKLAYTYSNNHVHGVSING